MLRQTERDGSGLPPVPALRQRVRACPRPYAPERGQRHPPGDLRLGPHPCERPERAARGRLRGGRVGGQPEARTELHGLGVRRRPRQRVPRRCERAGVAGVAAADEAPQAQCALRVLVQGPKEGHHLLPVLQQPLHLLCPDAGGRRLPLEGGGQQLLKLQNACRAIATVVIVVVVVVVVIGGGGAGRCVGAREMAAEGEGAGAGDGLGAADGLELLCHALPEGEVGEASGGLDLGGGEAVEGGLAGAGDAGVEGLARCQELGEGAPWVLRTRG